MSPFRRRQPLHEKLARRAGLLPADGGPLDPRPPLETGIHGLQRPREWDAVVTVESSLSSAEIGFVALPDGTLVVEDEAADDTLRPLADAVEAQLAPPYRAEAVRREGSLWAVAARRIEVVDLGDEIRGDELELAVRDGERTLLVDGERSFGSVPTLEALAAARHGDGYVVRALRLDGSAWEVRTEAL